MTVQYLKVLPTRRLGKIIKIFIRLGPKFEWKSFKRPQTSYRWVILVTVRLIIKESEAMQSAESEMTSKINLSPLTLELVYIICKNSIRTARKTWHFSITKNNFLTVFQEIMLVYSDNNTKTIKIKEELPMVEAGGTYLASCFNELKSARSSYEKKLRVLKHHTALKFRKPNAP